MHASLSHNLRSIIQKHKMEDNLLLLPLFAYYLYISDRIFFDLNQVISYRSIRSVAIQMHNSILIVKIVKKVCCNYFSSSER